MGARRPDGFHEVATALLAVTLADRLAFAPRARGFALVVDGPEARGVPADGTNLVVRAARALADALGERRGAAIGLTKRIPHGAGLGGGSSDAAATLRGLLALWGRTMPRGELAALAATLGSDVPFFLGGGFAMATGRGEIVRPLRPPPARTAPTFVVVVPDVGISTRWVYARHTIPKSRLTGLGHAATLVQLRAEAFTRQRLKTRLVNDLEHVVRPRVGPVERAFGDLRRAGLRQPRMSGSGSAVFGLVPANRPARAIAARLQEAYARVYVVRPARSGSRPCR